MFSVAQQLRRETAGVRDQCLARGRNRMYFLERIFVRKRFIMVVGRDRDLSIATSLVQTAGSVDIVGSRGSGRTAFLNALCGRLQLDEWKVVRLRGVASLRQHPLAAMQLAGLAVATEGRPPNVQVAAESLHQELSAIRSVVVVDDWDDLDESSWGIVEGVRRSLGVPVVISRLQGRLARHTPSGLDASTLEPAFVIEMAPLGFDDLEEAVVRFLGGPVETGTMSRLFAKSGGIVGLALSVVAAAVRENRMSRVDGTWTATRDLWSAGLRGVVEAYLENLPDSARDALEIVAIIGVADIDTVRKLVDWSVIELLEQRAMIQLVGSGTRHLVTVIPPLLVEFFRHEPLAARRLRLTKLIAERLNAEGGEEALASVSSLSYSQHEYDALFVRLVQERLRTRRLVARAEWEAESNADTVMEYATALMHAGAGQDLLNSVIERTTPYEGSRLNQARFAVFRAQVAAYVHNDVLSAHAHLDDALPHVVEFAPLLTAARVEIECAVSGVPPDFAHRLEVTDEMPDAARAALRDGQMLVLVSLGRFEDAKRVFAEYSADAKAAAWMTPLTQAVHALGLMCSGELEAAMSILTRGADEAHSYLDLEGARTFGAFAAFGYALEGDYEPVEHLLGTLLAAGDLPSFPLVVQQLLLNTAAVVAIRRGNLPLAERYTRQLELRAGQRGLLPGQTQGWASAQLLSFNGRSAEAAEALRQDAELLWERGGRATAALSLLAAEEIDPDPGRLAGLGDRIRQLSSPLFDAQYDYVLALAHNNGDALAASATSLAEYGRPGLALNALRRAGQIFRDSDRPADAARVEREFTQFMASLPRTDIDITRFSAAAIGLTERELEVARFVAAGLSNPEIASRLVLSVRTVESHMHRIMRKLELPNRQALKAYVESGLG